MKFLTALILGVALFTAACTGTKMAYKEAGSNPTELAYVVLEHYASLVDQAVALKAMTTTPKEAIVAMQRAEMTAAPVIDALPELVAAYEATKSETDAAKLQEAVNRAVLVIAELVRAVKSAQSKSLGTLLMQPEKEPEIKWVSI